MTTSGCSCRSNSRSTVIGGTPARCACDTTASISADEAAVLHRPVGRSDQREVLHRERRVLLAVGQPCCAELGLGELEHQLRARGVLGQRDDELGREARDQRGVEEGREGLLGWAEDIGQHDLRRIGVQVALGDAVGNAAALA